MGFAMGGFAMGGFAMGGFCQHLPRGDLPRGDLPWDLLAGSLTSPTMERDQMPAPSSDVAFTPSVKAVQEKRGSRPHFAKMEAAGGLPTAITSDPAAFLGEAPSVFPAPGSADGQAFVQHRGCPPGLLRVL